MKVVLINPPDPNSLDPKLDPPLGLMYISSYLKQNLINCEILDLSFYDKSSWKDVIEKYDADLYGLTVYSASVNQSDTINKLVKSKYPDSKIIWGGPHPTFEWSSVFKNNSEVDFIAMGEGEQTMLELCKNFNSPTSYDSIYGLGNRKIASKFFMSNERPLEKNLDKFPIPDRNSVPIRSYTRKVDGIPSCAIMTSRGCAYNCHFCCSKYFWKSLRFHGVKHVTGELNIIKKLGFEAFHCWDDTFTLNHNRLFKILDEIKNLKFTFRCNGDLRLDTKDVLQKLYDSGCREYSVGIESGDQKVLNAINKSTTVERNKQVLKWAKEIGLPVKAYIMVGNPGETWDSVQKTIDFIKETGPEYYSVFTFIPLPGCEFYHSAEKYGIKFRTTDWNQYFILGGQNESGCVIDTDCMTAEEIAEARQMLIRELPKQTGKLQDYYYEKVVKK